MILKLDMKHYGTLSCNGRKLARNEQMDRKFMLMKIVLAQGLSAPAPELYTFM